MTPPLVSVLTPVYNAEEYIGEVLDAIRAQTYPAIEHIVVDDGSTDGSAEIIRQRMQSAPNRVRLVEQANAGEASAVNRAFAESSGRYVVVVNADDPPLPELVERAVGVLETDTGLVAAYPDWEMISADGRGIRVVRTLEYSQQALVGDYVCIPGPGALIRADAVAGDSLRDTAYAFVSDYALWLRLSLKGEMRRVPEVLARWRSHPEGATSHARGKRLADEYMRVIDDFFRRDDLPAHVRSWERQAKAMAAYHSSMQSLFDPSVPGRRLMCRSLLTLFVRGERYPTHRRRFPVVVAVFLRPLSLPLVRRTMSHASAD